eukprot:3838631-Rhodomonas_salina.1
MPLVRTIFTPHDTRHETVCWGCGAKEIDAHFKSCPKCLEQSRYLLPAKFCSNECFKTAWPRHKKWHKKQLKEWERYETRRPASPGSDEGEEEGWVVDTEEHDPEARAARAKYNTLLRQGIAYMDARPSNLRKAAKFLQKAIEENPRRPEAYGRLADCYELSNHLERCWEMCTRAIEEWAHYTFVTFTHDDTPPEYEMAQWSFAVVRLMRQWLKSKRATPRWHSCDRLLKMTTKMMLENATKMSVHSGERTGAQENMFFAQLLRAL